ncbi:Serine/threonine-protein kinase WNK No protein [Perilla frutescens var. hirtella]|uniref:Serine/threonine-protein kinase WNK No protein n=1 Tax=Perilla frutescens var. hirtella TaxID=608512 RepID=A0AAD4P5K0_PERFH|nr:Serine/threonine-protein kinase WNK No protein [Perilla frutescens var. hirtella]
MEEQLNSLAVTHLLQHTLRSLCIHDNSQWVYAVFWRILPRNYPPPKWDSQGGVYDRSRGVRRNWILVWEDGFCNFGASATSEINGGECGSSSVYDYQQHYQGLQPEFLIGKVAADHSHKWIHKEPNDQEINFLSAWHNSADSHPRTWEAQFQSGIKTIALIAVREGVIQLGAVHKVVEDLSYVVMLRKKLSYIESIPGVLLPHPSSSAAYPFKIEAYPNEAAAANWHHYHQNINLINSQNQNHEYCYDDEIMPMRITPSMSSLEALLSKLPSVGPTTSPPAPHFQPQNHYSPTTTTTTTTTRPIILERVAKEEYDDDEEEEEDNNGAGETSGGSMAPPYHHYSYHQCQH